MNTTGAHNLKEFNITAVMKKSSRVNLKQPLPLPNRLENKKRQLQ